ncbi:hypothetical protein HY643_02870 [Candidatus Woesearchaeota archaeon]|nr:hypothetical protein [Candidatus Woesearchaeota archaeon]
MLDAEKIIEDALNLGRDYLEITDAIINMQEAREKKFDVRTFSRKKIYVIIGAAFLVCGGCTAIKACNSYNNYQTDQQNNRVVYVERFDEVKKE